MIALVGINTEFNRKRVPPLGLLYVGDALKKNGYDVQIFHCTPNEIEKKAKIIVRKDPIFIGFSVITGNQTRHSAEMSKEIKKRSDIPVVWGGPHPTLVIEQCLSEEYIDIVVRGEGEETSIDLAGVLEKKGGLKKVEGIGYKDKKNKIRLTEPRPLIENLDKFKLDWDLINVKDYLCSEPLWDCKRVIAYITSRGCPYNCGFCYNLVFNQRRWRCHSKEVVISDIEFLKNEYDIDGIKYFDDNFFVDKKRALKIAKAVDLRWHGEIRIDYLTRQYLKKLSKTNLRAFLIGGEAGSDRVLRLINKAFTVKDTIKAGKIISEFPEIWTKYSFIIGMPTETWNEAQKTIDLILRLHEMNPESSYTVGPFLPFPGTPLYDLAIKHGFTPPKKTEDWHILDRWDAKLDLTWLPWADKKTLFLIREYCRFLYLGTHYNIPLITRLARFRLANKNFSFPIDHKLIVWGFGKLRSIVYEPRGSLEKFIQSFILHKPNKKKDMSTSTPLKDK